MKKMFKHIFYIFVCSFATFFLSFAMDLEQKKEFFRLIKLPSTSWEKNKDKIIEFLQTHQKDKLQEIVNKKNYNALHIASRNGHLKLVKKLLSYGFDINISVQEYGITPLFCAVERKHVAVTKELIAHGANINHVDICEQSVLNPAAWTNRCKELVEVLLSEGINIDIEDIYGGSIHDWISESEEESTIHDIIWFYNIK